MTASQIFRLVAVIGGIAVVGIWFNERATAAELEARLNALRQQEQHLSDLRVERDRLNEQLFAAATSVPSGRPAVPIESELNRAVALAAPAAFTTGEWTPAAAWKNEGLATPHSTVSTLLWAAIGGDTPALQSVLEFDEATRAKARAWLETLPAATRSLYGTPEDLVASVTIQNIAPTAAQVTWFHETDADHAIVGVLVAGQSRAPSAPTAIKPADGNTAPSLVNDSTNQLAVLNLRRTPHGWRVMVPAAAIDRMAKVLGAKATQ